VNQKHKQIMKFQDDRQFSRVLDYHSYAREVRINYGDCASLPSAIDNYFRSVALEIADRMDYQQARSCCMGGNIHYAYHHLGALAFLTETGTAFQPPQAQMRAELVRILPGTLYFLTLPIPVSGHVLDRQTRQPIVASFDFPSLDFELGELKGSNSRGRYHFWAGEGEWNVTVSAPSYPTITVTLTATQEGNQQDILLG